MAAFMSAYSILFWTIVLAVVYIGYRAALPKPLPGIPYNQDAAGKLLGDVPEMMGYVKRTQRIFVRALFQVYDFPSAISILTPRSAGSPPSRTGMTAP